MSTRLTLPAEVDAAIPYSGPCGLCGGPEARHRVLDASAERVCAGEPVTEVAEDYRVSPDVVMAIGDRWDVDRQVWHD